MDLRIAALIATYRRPLELARLLKSLENVQGLELAVVVDNEGSDGIEAMVACAGVAAQYLNPGENLGCGGGLRLAAHHALAVAGDRLTHFLILDDDAILLPDTVSGLAVAMEREDAIAAYPLVVAEDGLAGWTPGLRDRALHKLGEERCRPAEFQKRFGAKVADFVWAQGICLLVRRDMADKVGFHRDDFWVRGEDLDYSLRLSARGRAIFVPGVQVLHYPPGETGPVNGDGEYLKHAAMVQNIAYLTLRLRHGRRQLWTLPGACRRFVRLWGWRRIPDCLRALWRGAILGEPAGRGRGKTFLARFRHLTMA